MREAKFYKKLDKQIVACELCCHHCLIKHNAVGICSVRKNINGQLFSLVYGRPVAINIDPIEKKPLFHFLPGSSAFSLGTFGCNFKCANCQNWELSQKTDITPLTHLPPKRFDSFYRAGAKGENLVKPEKIINEALANGCSSIAYTYNEPTVFAEYALDIMELAKQNNLKNIWVSNGYMSEPCLKAIIPYLDAANIDLKSFDEKFYREICGAKLKPVLKNLIDLKKSGVHLEITTLVIPKLSDGQDMLKKIAEFIVRELDARTPWHLSKFSPDVAWKLKNTPDTPNASLEQAYEIGKKAGLKYVYLGNVYGTDKENTSCPNCGQLAIKRLGYYIIRYDNNGLCAKCRADLNIIV